MADVAANTPAGELPRECLPCYGSDDEARLAYDEGELELHMPIMVRRTAVVDGVEHHKMVRTTVGRLIFNEGIPQDHGLHGPHRSPSRCSSLRSTHHRQEAAGQDHRPLHHQARLSPWSAGVLDVIKAKGYKFSTRGSLTVSIYDMTIPQKKYGMIARHREGSREDRAPVTSAAS